MKHAALIALVSLTAVLMTACSSEYVISTGNGDRITTTNKPMLNQRTGMVEYEDKEGRSAEIRQSEVNSIMQR